MNREPCRSRTTRRRRSLWRRLAWLLASSAIAGAGCKSEEAKVATLVEILGGSVEKAEGGKNWASASEGEGFAVGDALKTSSGGGARIDLQQGGGFRMAESTIVRFGRGALDLEGELQASEGASLDLVFGTAEISEGGRIKVVQDEEGGYRFDVLVGSATITRADGETVTLGQGEGLSFDVEFGKIAVDRPEPADAAPPSDSVPADAQPPPPAALIAAIAGRGARVRRDPKSRWERIGPGEHELVEGTEVRLLRRSKLELRRHEARATLTGAAEIVIGAPTGPLFETRRGEASVSAASYDVTVEVPGGSITARGNSAAGSRAELDVSRRDTQVRARLGRVGVVGKGGARESLQLGEWAELGTSGSITIHDRPPRTAHLALEAGQSAFIHDPQAPTHVQIDFSEQCAGDGVVEVARGRSFRRSARLFKGEGGSAIIRLPTGRHRYRVRCLTGGRLAEPTAGGRLRVNRASGTKRLPPRPVDNTVDADGRTYTVLYQNLLPHITFRWRSAPGDSRYRLHVVPRRGRARVVESDQNEVRLSSGTLDEGIYDYWFTDNKGRRSKKSRLKIGFNNAADTGYLKSPGVSQQWSSPVTVEGAAIKGWVVTLDGERLELDGQYRFKTSYAAPDGRRALAVGFSHPKRGTHYYVRRSR